MKTLTKRWRSFVCQDYRLTFERPYIVTFKKDAIWEGFCETLRIVSYGQTRNRCIRMFKGELSYCIREIAAGRGRKELKKLLENKVGAVTIEKIDGKTKPF